MTAGHYFCFVKRNNKWFICDDENVQEVSEKKVANEDAYLLFYRKITGNNFI